MTAFPFTRLTRTPATRALAELEFAHRLRMTNRRRRWTVWLRWGGLGAVMVAIFGLRTLRDLPTLSTSAQDVVGVVADGLYFALGILALGMFHGALSSALFMGARAIARERADLRWQLVTLTGVRARQLVWGKWLAVIGCLWVRHREPLAWRAIILLVMAVVNPMPVLVASGRSLVNTPDAATVGAWLLIVAANLTITLTNVVIASALALLCGAASRSEGVAYRLAGMAYVILTVVLITVSIVIAVMSGFGRSRAVDQAVNILAIAPLEGATFSAVTLFSQPSLAGSAVVAAAIMLAIAAALTPTLLLLTVNWTQRVGLSR